MMTPNLTYEQGQEHRALDKRIAALLGWYVAPLSEDDWRSRSGYTVALFTATGLDRGGAKDDDSAWWLADTWSMELHKALELIDDIPLNFQVSILRPRYEQGWNVVIEDKTTRHGVGVGQSEWLARAICEAWLEWKEAHGEALNQ